MGGDSKLKGNSSRVITTPGYHIQPQWDLSHTRHIIQEKRSHRAGFHLNLAPMVDMFSILVIYLIMNFSTSGEVFFIGKDIVIPKAEFGKPMSSFPLVSLVKQNVYFDSEGTETKKSTYIEELNDGNSQKLRAALKKVKDTEFLIGGKDFFRGQINLQADDRASIEDVKKIMRVLIEEGWNSINFIVEPKGSSK